MIGATASYRCFNCSGGYTACEDCGGKGLVSGEVCSKCLATGLCPCDFCNASGYIAVNLIPAELRLGVMEIRLKRAMAEAAPLLENPPPHSAAQNWRDRGRLLLKLNRLMGVAENGVTAAAQFIARDDENSHAVDQLVLGCNDLGSKIRQRMRDVLACLSDEQSMRGQFYRALAGHRSTGSWLDHSRIETPAGIEPSR
ncbi:MAG: hypothetical protein LLG01_05720 [Planctomycetaceae bacterium]|nr:hypothetical protein [Planctomycetaceae bacterium]